jgi:hypothetical protein
MKKIIVAAVAITMATAVGAFGEVAKGDNHDGGRFRCTYNIVVSGPNEPLVRTREMTVTASNPSDIIAQITRHDRAGGKFLCDGTTGRALFSYGAFERAYLGLFGWHLNIDKLTEWYIESESNSAVTFTNEKSFDCEVFVNLKLEDGTVQIDKQGSRMKVVSIDNLLGTFIEHEGYSDFTCTGKDELVEGSAVFSKGRINRYRETVKSSHNKQHITSRYQMDSNP